MSSCSLQDEIACLTIYNNMQWSACGVLYGLLQCPIPVTLKGDVLTALSHIAQVSEVAVGMMQITENAQLLLNKVNPFKGNNDRYYVCYIKKKFYVVE